MGITKDPKERARRLMGPQQESHFVDPNQPHRRFYDPDHYGHDKNDHLQIRQLLADLRDRLRTKHAAELGLSIDDMRMRAKREAKTNGCEFLD